MVGEPKCSGELVQMPVGQLAMKNPVKAAQRTGRQQVGSGRKSLADLQVRLSVQVGRLDVAQRVRLTKCFHQNQTKSNESIGLSPPVFVT